MTKLLCSSSWQGDSKHGALVLVRDKAYPSTLLFDDDFYEVEAKPCAWNFASDRIAGAVKASKDFVLFDDWDANSLVCH